MSCSLCWGAPGAHGFCKSCETSKHSMLLCSSPHQLQNRSSPRLHFPTHSNDSDKHNPRITDHALLRDWMASSRYEAGSPSWPWPQQSRLVARLNQNLRSWHQPPSPAGARNTRLLPQSCTLSTPAHRPFARSCCSVVGDMWSWQTDLSRCPDRRCPHHRHGSLQSTHSHRG